MRTTVTRRDFVRLSSVAAVTVAFGSGASLLAGCSSSPDEQDQEEQASTAETGITTLSVSDGAFSFNGSEESTLFTGAALSLVPSHASGTILLHYCDEQGQEQTVEAGPLNEPVHITGTMKMLNIDGVDAQGVFSIDPEASIDALCIGDIERAEISGSVCHLIMLGCGQAHALDGSSIHCAMIGQGDGELAVDASAEVETAALSVPESDCITGTPPDTATVLENPQSVEAFHSFLLEASPSTSTWDNLIDAVEASHESGQEGAAELTPVMLPSFKAQTAWADEVTNPEEGALGKTAETEENLKEATIVPDDYGDAEEEALTEGNGLADDAEPEYEPDVLGGASNGLIVDAGLELLNEGLKSLADAALDGAMEYGKDTLLNLIFGGKDEVSEQLTKIEGELETIESELSELIRWQKSQAYCTQVDNYLSKFSAAMRTDIGFLDGIRASIDEGTDGAEKEQSRRQFAEDLYANERYMVNHEYVYTMAAKLGNEILQIYTSTGTHLLGAFDSLMINQFKWEHHGYEARESFQSGVATNFLSLASYAEFCLKAHIEAIKDNPDKEKELREAVTYWNQLFHRAGESLDPLSLGLDMNEFESDQETDGICVQVAKLFDERLVKRLDESMRYYQVPGHEVRIAAAAKKLSTKQSAGTKQAQFMQDGAGHKVMLQEQYLNMYADYNKEKQLTDILFGKDEGNLTPPNETNLDFIGYAQPLIEKGRITHPGHLPYKEFYAPMVKNNGSTENRYITRNKSQQSKVQSVSGIGVFRV